ncbi:polysaccharide biosynthesis protein [Moraxella osloensis]|uniref:UDP-glucose 4-epimerase n=2 Tax=Faucicola osloensis TaxID=34062 RepID=A0A378QDJ6_FAUOS|nr:nucleoside-diphosphate sugar epimerase/dehydratase [Moraxella osloensis]AME00688.1 capsule biosynthesis protein CapD [Moraxella osloensis]STY97297.1 UDP-glucose 4-epimerase [Moraxella osloensis]
MSNTTNAANVNKATKTTKVPLAVSVLSNAIEQPRWLKVVSLFVIDYIASIITLILAIALRYAKFDFHTNILSIMLLGALPVIFLAATKFYSHVIRVFQDESMRWALVVLLGYLLISQILIFLGVTPDIPRAATAIHVFLLYLWIWNSRIVLQFIISRTLHPEFYTQKKENVLIYGVGHITKDLMHVLHQTHQFKIVGIIDVNDNFIGARVLGVKVYPKDNLESLITDLEVNHVFFVLPSHQRHIQERIVKQLENVPVKISEIPSLEEITSGRIKLSDIKPVDVLDVLQRNTVKPDTSLLAKNIKDKVVMVTGAGGSIGSELCRQILKQQPKALVLFELSEYALYAIHGELQKLAKNIQQERQLPTVTPLYVHLGSVTNQKLIELLCNQYDVQTIYHAAAYKHVPIVESNEYEGVINNFVGTFNTLQGAVSAGVETFVAISTDKAVRPTNVMGATKRMAELACQAMAADQSTTTISMVRFGNVLGSSGSVVPLFNKQIAAGGPITLTHPDVTRYFMTIPEAAQLVIQAGAMAHGGEVFVLDMGEPVKIMDLAKRMITLSGLKVKDQHNPNGDIEIVIAGLRPGEKLYEELIIDGDNIEKTQHPLIMKAKEHFYSFDEITNVINEVQTQNNTTKNTQWLRAQFFKYVEGYKPKQ